MTEIDTITLYQIDRNRKSVAFLTCPDADEDIQKSCTASDTAKTYSFDEILNQLENFRDNFFEFENLLDGMTENISKGREDNNNVLNAVENFRTAHSDNLFAVYYSEILLKYYNQGRQKINTLLGTFRNATTGNHYTQQQKDSLTEILSEIRNAVNDEWNFDFNTKKNTHLIRRTSNLIIIRGENLNQVWNIADDSLLNFYLDFSYAVKRLGVSVLRCPYCNKHYLGTESSPCCEKSECKSACAKSKRHAYENQTYVHERKAFKGYIRTKRNFLKNAVHGDSETMQKFNDNADSFYAPVDELLVEYMDENKPIDKTFTDLYQQQEKKLLAFMHQLIADWKEKCGI